MLQKKDLRTLVQSVGVCFAEGEMRTNCFTYFRILAV